jgi:pimeloyl-ACP methyl ester carboxylesterase
VLADLRARIRSTRGRTRFRASAGAGHRPWLPRPLLEHWAGEFDWRKQERALNRFRHFRIELDGVRSTTCTSARDGDGIPLIITHGWPSTFLERRAGPAADRPARPRHRRTGLDVVIPSLPGYGFSQRPA